jgi:hypothetical protein
VNARLSRPLAVVLHAACIAACSLAAVATLAPAHASEVMRWLAWWGAPAFALAAAAHAVMLSAHLVPARVAHPAPVFDECDIPFPPLPKGRR